MSIEKIEPTFIIYLYAATHLFVFLQGAKMFINFVRTQNDTSTVQAWVTYTTTTVFLLGLSLSNFYLFVQLFQVYNGLLLVVLGIIFMQLLRQK